MNQSLDVAVIKTLCYADIFDYPLTYDEIRKWLINFKLQIAISKFTLKKFKLIEIKNGFYFITGRDNIVKTRLARKKWSEEKIKIAEKAAKIIQLIPTVKLIGVTGALAMDNAKKNDDIDLFIITTKGFLWTTRFLVTILLEIMGIRRRPQDTQVSNKICLNMFVSEDCLTVPKKEQDLFSAHEVLQMRPVFNRDGIYRKFLSANQWVKKYLPNNLDIKNQKSLPKTNQHLAEKIKNKFKILNIILYPTEVLLKYLQLLYMTKRRTKEIITNGLVRFHPLDAREWILKNYHLRYSTIISKKETS